MFIFFCFFNRNKLRAIGQGAFVSIVWLSLLTAMPCLSRAQERSTPVSPETRPAQEKQGRLVGQIVDAQGAPLSSATVYVYTAAPRTGTSPFCPSCYADCGKHQVTNAQGRFLIPALSSSLLFRLLIVREGYEPTFVPRVDPLRGPVRVVLKKEDARRHDPRRQAAGCVLDPLGHPVVGATVESVGVKTGTGSAYDHIAGLDALAITNQRGEFRMNCPRAGSTLIALIKARGLAPQIASNLRTGARAAQTISMTYGTTVAGTVQDAAGRKITGAVVHVVPVDTNAETFVGWFEIGTDQEGRFSLPNIPANGQYRVCLRMNSLAASALGAVQQTAATGREDTTTGNVRFVASPAAAVTGQVTLTDGKPVPPGTRILLTRDGTWDEQQAILSDKGDFTFRGVPREEGLELFVRVPGHQFAADTPNYDPNSHTVRLKVPRSTAQYNLPIRLAPGNK